MSTLRKIVVFIIWIPALTVGGFFVFSLPFVISLRWANPVRTAFMWQKPGRANQTWVDSGDIAIALQSAVVSAEDARFYEHWGVDLIELEAAMKKNRRKGRFVRGFSTIPMQLAKNLYLSPKKVIARKVLEIALALEMEITLSKDRILEIYLNVIEWAPGVYGAEAAARHYFKKPASKLTSSEAAFLASIIPNPRKWGKWPPGPYVRKRMNVLMAYMGGSPKTAKKPASKPPLPEFPDDEEDSVEGSADLPFPEDVRTEPIPQSL